MRRAELALALLLVGALDARAQEGNVAHAKHMEWGRTSLLLVDQLELRSMEGRGELRFDLMGWVGGSRRRLWFRAEGEAPDRDLLAEAKYGWMLTPFWDLQLGAWTAVGMDPARGGPVVALMGMAPGALEVEASLLLDGEADLEGRLMASHDLYLAQRLVLQSRVMAMWSAEPDRMRMMGAGLGETELGLRLRYEFRREFAPYVGIAWERSFGETARLMGRGGRAELAIGVRLWF